MVIAKIRVGHAGADDLSAVVDVLRAGVASGEARQRGHLPALPDERVEVRVADDLAVVVDAVRLAEGGAGQGSEVGETAVGPKERSIAAD